MHTWYVYYETLLYTVLLTGEHASASVRRDCALILLLSAAHGTM